MAKYLNDTGLSYFYNKLKTVFQAKESGKGLSTNDYTDAEKNKLSGIATGAEVNQNAFSNVKVGTITVAADGKTDTLTLEAGDNVTITPDATNDKITIAAQNTTYSDATQSAHGLMSATDKAKLDGVDTGAEVNVIETVKMNGTALTVTDKAVDVTVPVAGTATPEKDSGTAAVGTSAKYAREDHVHPTDTSRASASHSHGNILTGGNITAAAVTPANNDAIVITDASASGKLVKSTIAFDGSTENVFLTKKGTFNAIDAESVEYQPADRDWQADTVGSALDDLRDNKVDAVSGKGLSTNDYTETEKNKLSGIASGAQVNVIETVKVNGTALSVSSKAVNVPVPTKTSDITNDSGFITSADIPEGAAASSTTPKMNGTAAVGTEKAFARGDHVHPTDTSRAAASDLTSHTGNTSNPHGVTKAQVGLGNVTNESKATMFTNAALTGTPTAPTAAAGTNTTQIATTEFVNTAVADALDDITGIDYQVVASLPATGTKGVIYLVAHSHGTNDAYDEYIWTGTAYEKIGNTDVDLSGYWAKADLVAITTAEIDTLFA